MGGTVVVVFLKAEGKGRGGDLNFHCSLGVIHP